MEAHIVPADVAAAYQRAQADRGREERLPSLIDGLRLRRVMHERTGVDFRPPRRYFTGWYLDSRAVLDTRVIVSWAPWDDGVAWLHASISHPNRMPSYDELSALHAAVFDGYAYQVFAPAGDHISIHPFALHLWGRMDGLAELPDFGEAGTI